MEKLLRLLQAAEAEQLRAAWVAYATAKQRWEAIQARQPAQWQAAKAALSRLARLGRKIYPAAEKHPAGVARHPLTGELAPLAQIASYLRQQRQTVSDRLAQLKAEQEAASATLYSAALDFQCEQMEAAWLLPSPREVLAEVEAWLAGWLSNQRQAAKDEKSLANWRKAGASVAQAVREFVDTCYLAGIDDPGFPGLTRPTKALVGNIRSQPALVLLQMIADRLEQLVGARR